jgi:hypothetical protein
MRKLFILQVCFGIFVLLRGLFVIPAMPYVMLDVVLTPEELHDNLKHDESLTLLQKCFSRTPTIVTGLFVISTSMLDLRLTGKIHREVPAT